MNRNLPLGRAVREDLGLKTFPNWAGPLKACLGRIHRWHAPSNWSLQEWSDELDSVARLAAVEAARMFDPERGVSFDTFIRSRVLARTLTFCRREWAYATRHFDGFSFPEDQETFVAEHSLFAADPPSDSESGDRALHEMLAGLSTQDVWLLEELYISEHTEAELAQLLQISQRAVNKRKHAALRRLLPRILAESGSNSGPSLQ